MHDNALALEGTISNSEAFNGYREDIPIPLLNLRGATGAALSVRADGAVGYEAVTLDGSSNTLIAVIWDDTADASDIVRLPVQLPYHFNPKKDFLSLVVPARQVNTTGSATENADLTLNAILKHFDPGAAALVVEAAQTHDFTGFVDATDNASYRSYASFEQITYTWSGQGLKPGSVIELTLGPSEAVGTANYIEMLGVLLRINRNACPSDRSLRDLT